MSEITGLIAYVVTWFLTIYIHEGGHYITAKLFNLNIDGFRIQKVLKIIPLPTAVKVSFKEKDFENIKFLNIKYILVIIHGILAGSIPLIIYLSYQNSLVLSLVFGVIYLRMCKGDLSMMWRFLHGERPYDECITTVSIPESQEECESIYPNCDTCGYFMENECTGDKDVFSLIYKPSDIERLRAIFKAKYGEESQV